MGRTVGRGEDRLEAEIGDVGGGAEVGGLLGLGPGLSPRNLSCSGSAPSI